MQVHAKSNWRNLTTQTGSSGDYARKLLSDLKTAVNSMPELETQLVVYRNYGDNEGTPNFDGWSKIPLSATISREYIEEYKERNPTNPQYVTLLLQPVLKFFLPYHI